MAESVTLELPEETLERYRRSAALSHRRVEDLLRERIVQGAPLPLDHLPPSLQKELDSMAALSDDQLWELAEARLSPGKQRAYTGLLNKNSEGALTDRERKKMQSLGDEARHLTLQKAQAYALLRGRGYRLPTRDALIRGR